MNSKTKDTSKPEERAHATWAFQVAAFPYNKYEEWNTDCIENFGNCRWMKMWHDHLAARNQELYIMLIEKIGTLESRLQVLEEKKVEKKVVRTLTQELEVK